MLDKAHRATTKDLATLRGSRVIRTKHLLFSYAPAPGQEPKLSCAVAKKVAKHAVDRNRLKRQCREALAHELPTLAVPVVGLVRILDANTPGSDFAAEVVEIIARLNKTHD